MKAPAALTIAILIFTSIAGNSQTQPTPRQEATPGRREPQKSDRDRERLQRAQQLEEARRQREEEQQRERRQRQEQFQQKAREKEEEKQRAQSQREQQRQQTKRQREQEQQAAPSFNPIGLMLGLVTTGISIIPILVIGFIIFKVIRRRQRAGAEGEEDTSHGSARFSTEKELQDWKIPANQPQPPGALALGPFGDKHHLLLPHEYAVRHTAIIGASGSGKSRGFFLPNCTDYNGSFIATDPKSELWKLTSGAREKPIRFAPRDPDNSIAFNFIGATVNDPHLTQLIARAIVSSTGSSKSDPFWENAETALLSSLIAHTATFEDEKGNSAATPAALYDFLTSHTGDELAAALLTSKNPTARQFANIYAQADPKVRGNIGIGLATKLTWLADPKTRRFTSSTTKTINFGQLREQQISCYWCLGENDVAALKPLSTLFFTLALYQLKQVEEGLPVCLFLDETANVGKIPDLETEIAVLRGRDISCVLGLQSYSQLEAVYGRERSQVILDNCTTKIILSGTDAETAERISRMLGERTLVEERVSYSKQGALWDKKVSTNTSTAKSARRLMFANEVREISRDEQLIIAGNRKPIYWVRFHFTGEPNAPNLSPLGEPITASFTKPNLPEPERKAKKKAAPPPMPDFKEATPSPAREPEANENGRRKGYTTKPMEEPHKVRGIKLLDDEPTTIRPVQPIPNEQTES
jgi:type IV secretion system protein VirD4